MPLFEGQGLDDSHHGMGWELEPMSNQEIDVYLNPYKQKAKKLGNLLEQATWSQKNELRRILVGKTEKYSGMVMEMSIVHRAIEQFDKENYQDLAIARYLNEDDIMAKTTGSFKLTWFKKIILKLTTQSL